MSNTSFRVALGLGIAMSVFACIGLSASPAFARTIDVEVGADVHIWIGEIADLGSGQFVITANSSLENCRVYEVGGANGLWEPLEIRGTDNANRFYFVQATYQYRWCGVNITWRPVKLNGHYVTISARDGDDTISTSTNSSSSTDAGNGQDWTFARSLGGSAYHGGDAGDDTLFAVTASNLLFGGEGNDTFCLDTYYAHVSFADGEHGDRDTRCGNGRSIYRIEREDCNNVCNSGILF